MKDYAQKPWLKPGSKLRAKLARLNLCRRIREKKALQQTEREIEAEMAVRRLMTRLQARARAMGPTHVLYYTVLPSASPLQSENGRK